MRKLKIKGRVRYQDLGTGFWGIIGDDGHKWRPVNMPEQLKIEGAEINVTAVETSEDASIYMWGDPVRIIAFKTPYFD